MPSKKARRKTRRKAARARAKREEERKRREELDAQTAEASLQQQQQNQRRDVINIAKSPVGANAVEKCNHGFTYLGEEFLCIEIIESFRHMLGHSSSISWKIIDATEPNTTERLAAISDAVAMMDKAISYLLYNGTEHILNGFCDIASVFASYASYFEQWSKDLKQDSTPKVTDPSIIDDHTLVRFFQKRIPCACLDEKYEEVKSITKMGRCWNAECELSGRKAVRSKMFYCTQCKKANYCSKECQKVDWKEHKEWCRSVATSQPALKFMAKRGASGAGLSRLEV